MSKRDHKNLLIVANFPAETGYAWDTIQEYFVALGQMFVGLGHRAFVCFPDLKERPERYNSTDIQVVKFDFLNSSHLALCRFIRQNRIGVLYLTDWPTYSIRYLCSRLVGVRTVIIHQRTFGGDGKQTDFKIFAKRLVHRTRFLSADHVIAISEYIRKMLIYSACFPEDRVHRIWNGIDLKKFKPERDSFIRCIHGIPSNKKIVFACSRAIKYKGIEVFIEAARILVHEKRRQDLVFVYCGDGPDFAVFLERIQNADLTDYFVCPGKTDDISRMLKGVDVVVVPSLWNEPFGLTVIEAMASEKVVVASKVGGIVDIIDDSVDGYFVPAGDSGALAEKIAHALHDSKQNREMSRNARKTVITRFDIQEKKAELSSAVSKFSGITP